MAELHVKVPTTVSEWVSLHDEPSLSLAELRDLSRRAGAIAAPVDGDLVVLTLASAAYPRILAERRSPPPILWCRGDPLLLGRRLIAVAGPRAATAEAIILAREAGQAVADAGFSLVCGLAQGIDWAGAEGAVEKGGEVVGVLAQGINSEPRLPPLPPARLLLLSEFRPSASWRPGFAMQRNRTIVSLASAIIAVEARSQSGTADAIGAATRARLPVWLLGQTAHDIPGTRMTQGELRTALRDAIEAAPWSPR